MSSPSSTSFADSLELVRRARQGERRALELLLARYRERLLVRVRLMLGPDARAQADSEDFLQSTLLAAMEHLTQFEPRDERAFLRWLTTIARNRIHDSVRRRREVAFRSLSESCSGDGGGRPPTPPSEVLEKERSMRLVEALESLAPVAREVVELRDLDGLGYREIGLRLGFDEERARYVHDKAVIELGRLLAEDARDA